MDKTSAVDRSEGLASRLRHFALQVIFLHRVLPRTEDARVISRQLLRSATGTAANYRAAARSRSRREFVARIGIALEEADETVFWLQLLIDAELAAGEQVATMLNEANQLTAILGASYNTAKRKSMSQA